MCCPSPWDFLSLYSCNDNALLQSAKMVQGNRTSSKVFLLLCWYCIALIQVFTSYHPSQLTFAQMLSDPIHSRRSAVKQQAGREAEAAACNERACPFIACDVIFFLLRAEKRSFIFQEGSGPATNSAFVEIIFDNSDHRFPVALPQSLFCSEPTRPWHVLLPRVKLRETNAFWFRVTKMKWWSNAK